MGAINYGTQIITYDYKNLLEGKSFNKSLHKVIPPGICRTSLSDFTFLMSVVSNTTVTINPGVLYIQNKNDTLSSPAQTARIETTAAFNLTTVSITDCWIIARFEWQDLANNYCDFLAVEKSEIVSTDIIIGKVVYTGVNATGINYNEKTWNPVSVNSFNSNGLRVYKRTTDPDNRLYISSCEAVWKNTANTIGGNTVDLTNSVTSGMISLIVFNSGSGSFSVLESTDTGSPTTPRITNRQIVIAKITRTGPTTGVKDEEIQSYHNNIRLMPGGYDDFLITGNIHNYDTTESTVLGTGSIVTDGGASIAKDLRTGGDIYSNIVNGDSVQVDDVYASSSIHTDGYISADGTIEASGGFSANFRNSAGTETTTIIKTKIIEIGAWDMDSTGGISVAHGLGSNILNSVSITATIKSNNNTIYPLNLVRSWSSTEALSAGIYDIDNTYISLTRKESTSGGFFDSPDFNGVGVNRGYITIIYIA